MMPSTDNTTNNSSKEKSLIDQLTKRFFSIFTNAKQQRPNWDNLHTICLPEIIIIKKTKNSEEIYNLDSFITPRKKIFEDGTLTDFEEIETSEKTKIVGTIAQRFSRYRKSGYYNREHFEESGSKFFQFIKTQNGWRINSLIWEDDTLQ